MGRVVVTDYFNFPMPSIRDALGDLATPGSCGCGKISLPSFRDSTRNIRQTFRHPDGHRLSFADFSGVIREAGFVPQYQFRQRAVGAFELRCVPTKETDQGRFEDYMHRSFIEASGFEVSIALVVETSLSREPSGKFFLFKSDVRDG